MSSRLPGQYARFQHEPCAEASVLLTGEVAHFGRFFGKTIAGVRILAPADFLREFKI